MWGAEKGPLPYPFLQYKLRVKGILIGRQSLALQ